MNYGRFFQLNTRRSYPNSFDYIWLKDNDAQNETPEYPIYAVITKECIEFKCHFYDGKRHLHNSILSLPLSANLEVKDGLTKALVDSYSTAFPSLENDYLCPLLMKAILNDKNEISYSDLEIFNKDGKHVREFVIKRMSNKPIEGFIRKLILDFLFDLEHTKVFQNSPYYEHVSVKLKENFFFNALANKAMYYHCRDIAAEENRKLFFLENYFLPAEEQWVKSITSPKADEAFNLKPQGWFKIPEDEMTDLQDPKEKNKENAISYFEKNKSSVNNNEIEERIRKSAKDSSKWQLKKYDLKNALPLHTFNIKILCLLFFIAISILSPLPKILSIHTYVDLISVCL